MQNSVFKYVGLTLFLTTLLLAGCSTRKNIGETEKLDSNVVTEFDALEKKVLRSKNPKKLLPLIEQFMKTHPEAAWIARGRNTKGLVQFKLKNYKTSEREFKKALKVAKSPYLSSVIRINLATAQFKRKRYAATYDTIKFIEPEALDPTNEKKYHRLKLRSAIRTDHFPQAIDSYSKLYLMNFELSRKDATLFQKAVQTAFELKLSLNEQINIAPTLVGTPLGAPATFHVGRRLFEKGDLARAKSFLTIANEEDSNGPVGLAALGLLAQMDRPDSIADPLTIGAILPLTGDFKKFGEQALKGIEQALDLIGKQGGFRLVIADSKGLGMDGANAVDNLVESHKVIAIIGGLVTRSAEWQVRRAAQLGVPFFSLSQKDVTDLGRGYAFQVGMTHGHQVRNLVDFASKNLGLTQVALMHSRQAWAQDFAKSFWKEVGDHNLEVKAVATYERGTTDFRQEVRSMVGLKYPKARNFEVTAREDYVKAVQEENPRAFRRGKNPAELPPIVDFQGVFIPEFPKTAAQIIPTFAYEDVRNIRFFGINTWNSNLFLKRAGGYAESSIFPGSFFHEDPRGVVQKFVINHKKRFGEEPDVISAQAYDAAKVVLRALGASRAESREALKSGISSMKPYEGVTGVLSFPESQTSQKELYLFVVRNGKAVPIKAPGKKAW